MCVCESVCASLNAIKRKKLFNRTVIEFVINGEIDTKTKESQHVKSKLNNEKRRAIAIVNTYLGCNQRKIIEHCSGLLMKMK